MMAHKVSGDKSPSVRAAKDSTSAARNDSTKQKSFSPPKPDEGTPFFIGFYPVPTLSTSSEFRPAPSNWWTKSRAPVTSDRRISLRGLFPR